SSYIESQYIKTIYDKTLGNNPWGIGLGIKAFLNNNTLIHPVIEIFEATYLENNKVLYLNPIGSKIEDVNNMLTLFAGVSIHSGQLINFFILTGPTVINSNIYLGVKPGIGVYLSKKQ